jgi:uncharacterized protein YjbI with pentapeptide repeats
MQCTYEFDPANDHADTSLTEPWSCPYETHQAATSCLLHMSPDEREEFDVPAADVSKFVIEQLTQKSDTRRAFIGAHIPRLNLNYIDVESENQYPTDLRHATIPGGISLARGRFEEQLDLRHSELGGFDAHNCVFEDGLLCAGTTFAGAVSLFEAFVTGEDADFTGAVFEAPARFDQADFDDDVSFVDTQFETTASFEGTQFYGGANAIGDNTTFKNATFHGPVSFLHATFEHTVFEDAVFTADAVFKKAEANGTIVFTGAEFADHADFDEITVQKDALFDDTVFAHDSTFRGVEFNGGATILDDDISFENAVFQGDVLFEHGEFGYANFAHADFNSDVSFERGRFTDDCTFEHAKIRGVADFDEVLFGGDANFSHTTFHEEAIFRGAEFEGGTNYLDEDVVFGDATFARHANFRKVAFTSANFIDAKFKQSADFTDTEISDAIYLKAISFGDDTYLNFTDASIEDGRIIQPRDGWVRFDLTQATLGDVDIRAETQDDERELLDYFRFCDTTFDGFDFSDHTPYFDRNAWNLHEFNGGTRDYEFALEMTPAVVERTYLNAKTSASEQSNIKAAGEFRVKRQQHARDKFLGIAKDTDESRLTRGRNALRGLENWFLGVSCGYGMRLYRVTAVFLLFPLVVAALFALGGPAFETGAEQIALADLTTSEGLRTLATNIYFSYITFLTIGYGDIAPIGFGARFLSGLLVYLNVILAGLFLYSLIKRSEV